MPDIDTSPAALREWHLGAMNDGLFIIDAPPRPSTDDIVHDREDGPTMILNVTDLPEAKAQAIVNAHNAAIDGLRASLAAAEKEQDEADASANKWMAQALAELGARGRVETSLRVSAETAAQLLERAEKAEAERDALAGPLTYGPYSCVPEHAVQCAYLLSLAEAEYQRDPQSNAAEILELYARGETSLAVYEGAPESGAPA